MMISTRDLSGLPGIDDLKRLMQSLAVLDLIMCDEWEDRYFSFNAKWDTYEMMGSMRNGSGDELFALFDQSGCFIKGFDHECELWSECGTPAGLYERVPEEFAACVTEPAFATERASFCLWRRYEDDAWQRSEVELPERDDPDGSACLLGFYDGQPETWHAFAEDYYERELDPASVQAIYQHEPLTRERVGQLNPERQWGQLLDEFHEIGYPQG